LAPAYGAGNYGGPMHPVIKQILRFVTSRIYKGTGDHDRYRAA
jgi:hypothetical protein